VQSTLAWSLFVTCAAVVFGVAVYRWQESRTVIRAVQVRSGIWEIGSREEQRGLNQWIATDTDVSKICLDFCELPQEIASRLPDLPGLTYFGLMRCTVKESDLEALGRNEHLTMVWFNGCNVTDGGLQHLSGLKNLRHLSIVGAAITDGGLTNLREMASLKELTLSDCWIGDRGLSELRGLNNLKTLKLERTRISDAGVPDMKILTSLDRLDITGTAITPAGVAELEKSLTHCKITGP
jgi:hypothetical protein